MAVVGRGGTLTAGLLRRVTGAAVVELTPCQAAMAGPGERYRAVVVENFLPAPGGLSGCAVARWELSRRAGVTVVGLDEPEGRRLAASLPGVYAYSDGRPQADLTAKNVRIRGGKLEFEALTDRELLRVRVPAEHGPRLYDHLAALAGALALGIPLRTAAERLGAG